MKKLILVLIILGSNLFLRPAYAQDEHFQKQFEEIMKAREEMLRSLLDNSMSGDFEKRMQEMMNRFATPGFELSDFDSPLMGEYQWVVSDTHKILKIKVQQVKDQPLDIKIEQGMIRIKGDVQSTQGTGKNKVISRSRFERSFSLPDDIDQNNPEFENKDDELLVKFKKLAATKTAPKPKTKTPAKAPEDRLPITPNSGDLSI